MRACVCASMCACAYTYGGTADLFVGGEVLSSQEGTTQDDPLAMCMYAIGILPLIRSLQSSGTKQVWYEDDATGGGTLEDVKNWWDHLISSGQAYGYHPNAAKSWIVVKETKREEATSLFEGTGIHITTQGRRLLGAAIGTRSSQREHVENTIAPLVQQLSRLSEIAKTQPHAAYAALTHGLASKWTFLCRTMDSSHWRTAYDST